MKPTLPIALCAAFFSAQALADEYHDCLNRNAMAFNSYSRFSQIDEAVTGQGVYGLHATMTDQERAREASEQFKQACRNNPSIDLRAFMEGAERAPGLTAK